MRGSGVRVPSPAPSFSQQLVLHKRCGSYGMKRYELAVEPLSILPLDSRMLRLSESPKGRRDMTEKFRSDRESALLEMGVTVGAQRANSPTALDVVNGDASLAFSGYGAFTPITIRSETVLTDAHLERNQH